MKFNWEFVGKLTISASLLKGRKKCGNVFVILPKILLRNNQPQNQYYANHNNGAQSPNRGVQPALTGFNRGNNGASGIQPPSEVIQHAVNRAVQQYLGQMGGYGKRPFVDDSSFL